MTSQADRHAVKAFIGGTLIDGAGKAPVRNAIALVRDARIEAVGRQGVSE